MMSFSYSQCIAVCDRHHIYVTRSVQLISDWSRPLERCKLCSESGGGSASVLLLGRRDRLIKTLCDPANRGNPITVRTLQLWPGVFKPELLGKPLYALAVVGAL
jgi:hypothetical protein